MCGASLARGRGARHTSALSTWMTAVRRCQRRPLAAGIPAGECNSGGLSRGADQNRPPPSPRAPVRDRAPCAILARPRRSHLDQAPRWACAFGDPAGPGNFSARNPLISFGHPRASTHPGAIGRHRARTATAAGGDSQVSELDSDPLLAVPQARCRPNAAMRPLT